MPISKEWIGLTAACADMLSLGRRATIGLIYLCVFFTLTTIAVGLVGVLGVRSASKDTRSIVSDELTTTSATARVALEMEAVRVSADELFRTVAAAPAKQTARDLYDVEVPRVDNDLTRLVVLHANDGADELADIRRFVGQWHVVRAELGPGAYSQRSPARAARFDLAFAPLSAHIDALLAQEQEGGALGQQQVTSTARSITWSVLGAALLAVFAAAGAALFGIRNIRQAVEPERDQTEFADSLQVTASEHEAHQLLKDHLERALPDADATVLNRNNSADRLEAMTSLGDDSCLTKTLAHASPRSCLAIRSARTHSHDDRNQPLLSCGVCGSCPGSSTCTPFTVSGEVIGAVLVTSPSPLDEGEQRRIAHSVSQAAPVLANLRNVAIAEVRAATDSLTGLPNKRAVTDTLKRMLAQASRTLTPLSFVSIDLDHFKTINDRYGHPVGDQALANAGAAIASAIRASDFAGRNGGEEFALLLPDTDLAGAVAVAEKVRLAIAGAALPPGVEDPLTASLGIAVYPDHATNAERLERLADSALYAAKRAGRNRTEVADYTGEGTNATVPPEHG
jgi:diguanylate cyclase (GGDEF)-like protein